MSGFAEYDNYDALGLAELVKARAVTPVELLEEAISRVERVDPQVNAVVHRLYERAREQVTGELPQGVFEGVPLVVKDLIQSIPGVPLESGSRFWKGHIAQTETTLMKRWLATGVVPFAKSATPELGILPVTEPVIHGATRTPWDTNRTSGGSSGGSGALVGSRAVPMATGGDGGGSIRIPAACCGVFGLKPSRARNPAGPQASEGWAGFVSEHVLTVSVRDSAAMLDATHGPEETAPYHAPAVEGTFLQATQNRKRKLRIGYHTEPAMPATVHHDCEAAVNDAVRLCKELGHEVVERAAGHDQRALGRAFMTVITGYIANDIREGEEALGKKAKSNDYELTTRVMALLAEAFDANTYVSSVATLQREARRLVDHYRGFDLILTPTLAKPPILVGELDPKGFDRVAQSLLVATGWKALLKIETLIDEAASHVSGFVPFTPVANFTGRPSMSVPLFWNSADLPIGVMFTGHFGDEQTLFSLAAQLEEARPWRDRQPPVT